MASKHPAVTASEDERTSVDPGSLDEWHDERTVLDDAGSTTDVTSDGSTARSTIEIASGEIVAVNRATQGSGSETIDEMTREEPRENFVIPSREEANAFPKATLVIRTGPHEGQQYPLAKSTLTIGRALDNDIVLVDPSISRHHLRIEWDGSRFHLVDLNSGNGTIVNGKDEDERYHLANRDALELGRSIITFECAALSIKAPTISPPRPRDKVPVRTPNPAPEARPTVSLKSTSANHEKLDESDVDDDVSTIAGERPAGLARPAGSPSFAHRAPVSPRSLASPPERLGAANLRMTVPSPAVPPPKPRPSEVRVTTPRNSVPTSSPPTPIVRPVSLEEEEPTRAQPSRNQGNRSRASSLAAPRGAPAKPIGAAPLPSPPRVAAPISRPPQPHAQSSGQLRPQPHSTAPPPMSRPGMGPAQAGAPMGAVVYPSAPPRFNRSGAAVALSPRSGSPGGSVQLPKSGSRKWLVGIAALALATVAGVTVAAITGGDASTRSEATKPAAGASDEKATEVSEVTPAVDSKEAPTQPIVVPIQVDAGVREMAGAATKEATSGQVAVSTATLPPTALGTYETVLATLPANTEPLVRPTEDDDSATDKTDDDEKDTDKKDDDEKDIVKTATDEKDTDKTATDKTVTDKKDDDEKDLDEDAVYFKRTTKSAETAYRDRKFSRAAALSRNAALRAPNRREAKLLRKRAGELSRLQTLLSEAKDDTPVNAFRAYQSAKPIDRDLGRLHQAFLNAQLLRVGPDAARSYMVDGAYAKAAKAVTISRQVGDRKRTDSIMKSLERKARELVKKGQAADDDGDTDQARTLYNRAKTILPKQSDVLDEVKELLAEL